LLRSQGKRVDELVEIFSVSRKRAHLLVGGVTSGA
jgi:hypothetical protein